jgi:hypothetical protein
MNETAHGKELPKPLQPRRRFHRFSTVELLVALALLFFFFPFVEEVKGGDVIMSILLSLVLLSAVLAVADRKGVFFITLVLAIPAIAGRWINHFRPDLRIARWLAATEAMTGLLYVTVLIARLVSLYSTPKSK